MGTNREIRYKIGERPVGHCSHKNDFLGGVVPPTGS